MAKIVVLNYGSSNLRSIVKALETVASRDQRITVSNDPKVILAADKIVFPGQGAIGQCMRQLQRQDLGSVIKTCILNKPFFGICLGLQSLLQYSDEDGGVEGLNLLAGRVSRFADNVQDSSGDLCKVPAMGWNRVRQTRPHPLWHGIEEDSWFYFVHSYYVMLDNTQDIVGSTDYIVHYACAVARDNLFATQFHPEKSQHLGLTLLKNFLNWRI